MGKTVGVHLLGPTALVVDGRHVELGSERQRRLLAALALDVGTVVPADRLADRVWADGELPDDPRRALRTNLARLRQAIGDVEAIVTEPTGWRLDEAHVDVDSMQFGELVSAASEPGIDVHGRLARLDEALALWRGAAYEDVAGEEWARGEAARLDELRLTAVERRYDAMLAAGMHTDALPGLTGEVDANPLRDRLVGLQMLALYRSGRQAEATRVYEQHRRRLADELGLEPGAQLHDLDSRIVAGDPSLHLTSTAGTPLRSYRLGEQLGEGAFAVVYRGTQPSVGRDVAVKVIRAELANRPEFVRRFEAEAHLVARLEHPYIVPLYDYWREPDRACLVFRYLRGGTLEARLTSSGPLSLDECGALVSQIGAALATAHAEGVVHRDVKPANVFLDEVGNFYLGDFGIALEATEVSDPTAALSAGSPAYASPEQLRREPVGPPADVHGLGISIYEALTGRLPFPAAAGQAELLQHQLHDPIPSVRDLRGEIPATVDAVIQRATAKDPAARYQTAQELIADFDAALRADHPKVPVKQGSATVVTVGEMRNPYKGLRAFTEADSGDFHGRERLVDRLLGMMSQTGTAGRIAAVVGPSGIGKSSVVRAGLLPALRSGSVPTSERWFVATMLPGSHPFDELAAALLRVATHAPDNLMGMLTDDRRGIARVVKALLPEDDGSDVLLVIDQFEELFTLTAQAETVRFLDALEHAVTDTRCPLRVVLTMRADFWDRPLRHGAFARLIDGSTVNVTALAPDELERAIVAPVHQFGVEFEPGLVSEIVADVNDQPGALPLLQYALTELWERRVAGVLTRDAYRELGGVTGALARRAEELYLASTPDEQQAARRLFGRLVTLGEGTEDVRRRALRNEVGDDAATTALIERFGSARLFSFDHDPSTREPTIEVAHEALIREWPRLREWLDADRDDLRVHRHLTDSAAAWSAGDRDPGELYRGARLVTAEPLLTRDTVSLNATEAEFLQASVQRRDDEEEAERARVRRLRRLVVATAVVAVVALLAGAVALVQWRRADDQAAEAAANAEQATASEALAVANAERAATNEALAEANADDAAASAQLADERAIEAEYARRQGDLERLRAVALSTAGPSPTVAALLAVESNRILPSAAGLDVLHRVMTEKAGYRGSVPGGPYLTAQLLDDDVTLVAAGAESADVWDLSTREMVTSIDHASPDGSAVIAVVDDERIALLGAQRTVTTVYDLASGAPVGRITHGAVVNDIAVSPDGTRLAAAMQGGSVEVWDVNTFEPITVLDTGEIDAYITRWNPVDGQLAVVTLRSEAQLWNVDERTRLWSTEAREAGIVNQVRPYAAAFSPNGSRFVFVAGSVGGGIRTLDTADGTDAAPPIPLLGLRGFPLDDIYWADEATVVIPSGGNVLAFTLDAASPGRSVVPQFVLRANSVAYSSTLDQHIIAGLSGLEFWSADGSGPLERVVPLPPEHLVALAQGGGPILATLAADGSRLLVSTFLAPSPPPLVSFDLTSDPPRETRLEPAITVGFGEFTLSAANLSWQMLDADLTPLGAPVPLPFDFSEVGASEDGRYVAIGRLGGLADVYTGSGDSVGTVQLGQPAEFAGAQVGPSFTSDGEFMVLSTTDGRSGLWATATMERIDRPDAQDDSWSAAVGPWLFVRSGAGAFQRLDPDSMEPISGSVALNGLGALGYPKLDPTNARLAATGQEVVKVFDLTTGRQLGRDLPFAGAANRIEFTADGSILSVPTSDRITLWNFDTDTWADIACRMAGRNLTRDEWEQYGPRTFEYRATCPQFPIETG